jgi:O-antigen/teichoic acid export membrane protein
MAVLLSAPMAERFSIWIFHDSQYVDLFFASLFMLFGFALYNLLYGYYRGIGKIKIANLWQLGVMAFGPLIMVDLLIEGGRAADMVAALGCLFAVTAAPLVYFCIKGLRELRISHVRSSIRELIRYGAPRTPGGLAFAGLLTMAPFLAPYFGTLNDAGYLVVAQSLFRVMEGAVVAFGLVALPRVARYEGEGRENTLKDNIRDLNAFIFQVGLFFSLQLFVWTDLIIFAWLGPAYQDVIPLMRVLVLSLPTYLGYVMLRSVIDAVELRAVNTLNIFIGLVLGFGTAIVLAAAGLGVLGLAIGTTAGLFVVGAMSVFYLWQRYRFSQEMVLRTFLANGIFMLPAWAANQWFIDGYDLLSLIYAFGIEGVLFLGYLILLWTWKVEWLVQIQKRVRI